MSAKKILITKTQDDSAGLPDAMRAAGYEPVCEPMLSIEYIDAQLPPLEKNAALIFTSSHGVQAFARLSGVRNHPVYAVGRNTADTARDLGFTQIEAGAGTADDLVELIVNKPQTDLIAPIYVRAEDVSRNLKDILAQKGINITEYVAYRANPVENLSISLLKSLDNREIYAVLLFSNRGARVFAELIEQYDRTVRVKPIKALCISDSVLKSVSVLPFQQAIVAETPDRRGMMELLDRIFPN